MRSHDITELIDFRELPDGSLTVQPKASCAPLCGASQAYGRYDKWWLHEPSCPMREALKP